MPNSRHVIPAPPMFKDKDVYNWACSLTDAIQRAVDDSVTRGNIRISLGTVTPQTSLNPADATLSQTANALAQVIAAIQN